MVGRRIEFEKTAATDTTAPTIAGVVQSPAADEVDPGEAVTVTAMNVADDVAVKMVLLGYSTDDATFYSVIMTPVGGTNNYTGRIPAAINTANTSVTYRISAEDTSGNRKETSDHAYRVKAAPPAVRDVAVTRVTPSPAKVTVGENVTITVTVKNNGSVAETFDVSAYYDTAEIGTQTVANLAAGANKTLTFAWDTTGVDAGVYTIRVAATLSGDTNTANDALEADEPITVKEGAPSTMPWMWLGIGVAMAVVAVVILTIIVAAYMLTRKKP